MEKRTDQARFAPKPLAFDERFEDEHGEKDPEQQQKLDFLDISVEQNCTTTARNHKLFRQAASLKVMGLK